MMAELFIARKQQLDLLVKKRNREKSPPKTDRALDRSGQVCSCQVA